LAWQAARYYVVTDEVINDLVAEVVGRAGLNEAG
jgi:hypothetical protein